MPFDPTHHIVKLCLQAMALEEKKLSDEASSLFLRAWTESTTDFDRFLTAYFVARHQASIAERIKWLETSLESASKSNDQGARSALATLYARLAESHHELGNREREATYRDLVEKAGRAPVGAGPFFHGTRAELQFGDLLTPGRRSNYQSDIVMNHVYFTALVNGAGLAAGLAKGEGRERVYLVEPTGGFEDDPNVTNKKFPGNLTRSYRTSEPLKVIGEVTDWARRTPEELQQWREKLKNSGGTIIN